MIALDYAGALACDLPPGVRQFPAAAKKTIKRERCSVCGRFLALGGRCSVSSHDAWNLPLGEFEL